MDFFLFCSVFFFHFPVNDFLNRYDPIHFYWCYLITFFLCLVATPCTASPDPCNNHGNCTVMQDQSTICNCTTGWNGTHCENGKTWVIAVVPPNHDQYRGNGDFAIKNKYSTIFFVTLCNIVLLVNYCFILMDIPAFSKVSLPYCIYLSSLS